MSNNPSPPHVANTMERFVPDYVAESSAIDHLSQRLHEERYRFACRHVRGPLILDIACGSGYGSQMIAATVAAGRGCVVGVDYSAASVTYASQRYPAENLYYAVQDAHFVGLPQRRFSTIISLETIEHLAQPPQFVQQLRRVLLPGGVVICSAPVTPSVDANPWHRTDFTSASFRRLFQRAGFIELAHLAQVQPYSIRQVLQRGDSRTEGVRRNLLAFYRQHPAKLLLRLHATLTEGLVNRYLTCVWLLDE